MHAVIECRPFTTFTQQLSSPVPRPEAPRLYFVRQPPNLADKTVFPPAFRRFSRDNLGRRTTICKMKSALLFVIVVVGFAVVSAELEDELRLALKELLESDDMLQFQSRDTKGSCVRDTNNCNGLGQCVQGSWGGYYCKCNSNAKVGGSASSCYLKQTREETDMDMEVRDSIARCNADTNSCNQNGVCQESMFVRDQYKCVCDTGFTNDASGSCVAMTKREMALLDMSLRDSKERCISDTNNCNEVGECLEGRFSWKCVCNDPQNYKIDTTGSCVPKVSTQSRTAELMQRLAGILNNEE